jgi:hypothetical protein
MRKVLPLIIFFLGFPFVLGTSFFLLSSLNIANPSQTVPAVLSSPNTSQVLSAFSDSSETSALSLPSLSNHFTTADARPLIIRNYLHHYSSPLEPYFQHIVDISDKYSLDYRILVAIAQQESNLCKKIPTDSYNCWGFGIYGTQVTRFDNYLQGIDTVAKTLKKDYIDRGLDTPEKIMAKYTPPSVEIGGPWAKGVNQFLQELE